MIVPVNIKIEYDLTSNENENSVYVMICVDHKPIITPNKRVCFRGDNAKIIKNEKRLRDILTENKFVLTEGDSTARGRILDSRIRGKAELDARDYNEVIDILMKMYRSSTHIMGSMASEKALAASIDGIIRCLERGLDAYVVPGSADRVAVSDPVMLELMHGARGDNFGPVPAAAGHERTGSTSGVSVAPSSFFGLPADPRTGTDDGMRGSLGLPPAHAALPNRYSRPSGQEFMRDRPAQQSYTSEGPRANIKIKIQYDLIVDSKDHSKLTNVFVRIFVDGDMITFNEQSTRDGNTIEENRSRLCDILTGNGFSLAGGDELISSNPKNDKSKPQDFKYIGVATLSGLTYKKAISVLDNMSKPEEKTVSIAVLTKSIKEAVSTLTPMVGGGEEEGDGYRTGI